MCVICPKHRYLGLSVELVGAYGNSVITFPFYSPLIPIERRQGKWPPHIFFSRWLLSSFLFTVIKQQTCFSVLTNPRLSNLLAIFFLLTSLVLPPPLPCLLTAPLDEKNLPNCRAKALLTCWETHPVPPQSHALTPMRVRQVTTSWLSRKGVLTLRRWRWTRNFSSFRSVLSCLLSFCMAH